MRKTNKQLIEENAQLKQENNSWKEMHENCPGNPKNHTQSEEAHKAEDENNCSYKHDVENLPHVIVLNNNMDTTIDVNKKLGLRIIFDHGQYHTLWSENIISIVCHGNISTIDRLNDETLIVTRSLNKFSYLLDTPFFIRISKCEMVNIRHIVSFRRNDNTLKLINGKTATIGTAYLKDWVAFFKSFWIPQD